MNIEEELLTALADVGNCADDLSSYIFSYGCDDDDIYYLLLIELGEAIQKYLNLIKKVVFENVDYN